MVNLSLIENLTKNLSTEKLEEIERRLVLEYHSYLQEKERKFPPYWIESALERIEKALREKKKN